MDETRKQPPRVAGRLSAESVDAGGERDSAGLVDGGLGSAQQVVPWIFTPQLGSFDERVEQGGDLGAALGFAAVVILAAQHDVPELALHVVVVQRDFRLEQEDG